ncbi:MAG: GNAT family N-acetyltransferase [Dehalococcoidia bacterium]
MRALKQRDLPGPCWYLNILGVDPIRQGTGIGGRLVKPILQRGDAQEMPCYLETFKERNLRFYQKHGFRVLAEAVLPEDGPRFWTMLRQAHSYGSGGLPRP